MALADREKRLAQVVAGQAAVEARVSADQYLTSEIEHEARKRIEQLQGVFARNPDEARACLQTLATAGLNFLPIDTAAGRRFQIQGPLAMPNLLLSASTGNHPQLPEVAPPGAPYCVASPAGQCLW